MRFRSLVLCTLAVTACAKAAAAPPPDPRAELAARRAAAIDELHAYWVAGNFPINDYSDDMLNVFRDREGRLCAIANLVHRSGHDDLVDSTVKRDNFVALRDVHDGPLMDWILDSGLTQEEVVLVQGIGYESIRGIENVNGAQIVFETVDQRIARQRATIRQRLAGAEMQLRAETKKSLDLAVARRAVARAAVPAYDAVVRRRVR